MATTANEETESARGSWVNVPSSHRPVRRRSAGKWLFGGLLLAAVFGGGAMVLPRVINLTGSTGQKGALTHTVARGRLLITVTEDGNVESASNVDVKCRVTGGSTILWIVEDGKEVEKGEEIIRLDESNIEDQLNSQRITYEKALAAKIQAQEDFEAAEISVREYKEGTYLKELQDVEATIIIAMQNLRSAENMLEYTEKMARKAFRTPLELEADQFAVERAKLELKSANTAKTVLEKFTRAKTLKELEAKREAAAAKLRSDQAALDLEKDRLDRLEAQKKNCVIAAPQNGMVVYANDARRSRYSGQQSVQIEEGAMVRERQVLIRLPDLSKMQVKVTVHESKVEQIKLGMPARIVVQGREMQGKVVSVANQPEPTSWFSANVKQYATIVSIEGESNGLKPGMTAEVEILIADVRGAMTIPVSSVVEQRGKFYAWVQTKEGPERRPLVLGLTNDKVIEIKDGVKEGDEVLLNPRAVVAEAREEGPIGEETDAEKKESRFGSASSDDAKGQDKSERKSASRQVEVPARGKAESAPHGKPSPKSRSEGGRPGGGAGRGGQRRGSFNLMQFDKDGDKKISRDELPERMRSIFDRLDGNGDGFIDAKEIAAMRSRFSGGGGRGRPGGGRPGGPGGRR